MGQSSVCFLFQAEDGIRDAQESRGLGDVYKRQRSLIKPAISEQQFLLILRKMFGKRELILHLTSKEPLSLAKRRSYNVSTIWVLLVWVGLPSQLILK